MKTILHALYGGEVAPYEEPGLSSKEFYEVNRKIQQEKRYFTGKLLVDDCQRFEQLEGLYSEASDMEVQDAFCRGFRLGAKILMEIFAPPRERPQRWDDDTTE